MASVCRGRDLWFNLHLPRTRTIDCSEKQNSRTITSSIWSYFRVVSISFYFDLPWARQLVGITIKILSNRNTQAGSVETYMHRRYRHYSTWLLKIFAKFRSFASTIFSRLELASRNSRKFCAHEKNVIYSSYFKHMLNQLFLCNP